MSNQIKKIIAVASGKGGVGKSTIAINLALAFVKKGNSVGLLDADIYGPSQPLMMGAKESKPLIKEGKLHPIEKHGLKSISMGYLIDQTAPVVWRGPMLGKALEQFINDTVWGELDYLIVDLPPGTGDVQMSLCQKITVNGVVVVTTPQDLALSDVVRACEMFKKLNVPLLGIVENMSVYQCAHCGEQDDIFGEGGGKRLASNYDLPLFSSIPLSKSIREMTDNGVPPIIKEPDGEYSKMFLRIAEQVEHILSLQPKDYSKRFPKIVVEQKEKDKT